MRASGTKVLQMHLQAELGSTFGSGPPCVIRAPNSGTSANDADLLPSAFLRVFPLSGSCEIIEDGKMMLRASKLR